LLQVQLNVLHVVMSLNDPSLNFGVHPTDYVRTKPGLVCKLSLQIMIVMTISVASL
jgi:hypothetical protein